MRSRLYHHLFYLFQRHTTSIAVALLVAVASFIVFNQTAFAAPQAQSDIAVCPSTATGGVGQICGKKYHDLNANGALDSEDPVLVGWPIEITGAGLKRTVQTDDTGTFVFDQLPEGAYIIAEGTHDEYVQVYPPTGVYSVTLQPGIVIPNLDFINVKKCKDPVTDGCTAGVVDNFDATNGAETPNPSPQLQAFLNNCSLGPLNQFDTITVNHCLGHTFGYSPADTCLDTNCRITGAQLIIKLHASQDGGVVNDHVSFMEYNPNLNQMEFVWSQRISNLDANWGPGAVVTLTLDLANLIPGSPANLTNILAALQDGDLDVVVDEDSGVDYITLKTIQCCNCATPPSDMTAWWTLDELSGPTAADIVGVANNGAHINTPAPIAGVVNGALSFNAANAHYVEAPDDPELDMGTGDLSIDAWLWIDNEQGVQLILDKREENVALGVKGYSFYVASGQLAFQLADAAAPSGVCSSNNAVSSCTNYGSGYQLAVNRWQHVAVTVDRDVTDGIRWYVDGVEVGNRANPTIRTGSLDNSSVLRLANRSIAPAGYLQGRLDEVELFKRVLTPQEIKAIYKAQSRGKCRTGKICGVKYHDLNGNGVRDPGEPGLPGWIIQVVGTNAFSGSATTAANGAYCVALNQVSGPVNYTVNEVQQAGWTQTAPATPGTHSLTLGIGIGQNGVDFGNIKDKEKPDLIIEKKAAPVYIAGNTGVFTLTVTNIGSGPTTGPIVVTDTLPPTLTPLTATGSGWVCTIVGQTVTCTHPGPLPPSSSLPPITISATVAFGVPIVENCADVTTQGDANPNNNHACASGQVQQPDKLPDLTIKKGVSGTLTAGQPGIFVLNVSNVGTGATTGPITVSDVLQAPFTPLSAGGAGWTCTITGQTVTCTHPGPLGPGNSLPPIFITVSVGYNQSVSQNCANVATQGDGKPQNNESCITVDIKNPQQPDLTIKKTLSGTLTAGGTGIFVLAVSNLGPGATTGPITVVDTLPAYLTPASVNAPAPWSCAISGQTVTCTHPGPLPAGGSLPSILISVQAQGGIVQYANCALVKTPGDVNPNNNEGCVKGILSQGKPDLIIKKAISGTLVAGQPGSFVLMVSNIGTGPTTGPITVGDSLLSMFTPLAAGGPGWSCTITGQNVLCTHPGPLGPSSSLPPITITVQVSSTALGFENCAKVKTIGESNYQNNSHCIHGQITPAGKPDLAIKKKVEGAIVPGQPGFFLIQVKNVGTAATTGPITVVDSLPAGLTPLFAYGPPPWSCTISGQVVTCVHPGPLAAGNTLPAIVVVVQVSPNIGHNLVNCAVVSTPGDTTAQNNRSCVNLLADSDHDLVADTVECPTGTLVCRDLDGDNLPDYLDEDDDGDGIPTASELGAEGVLADVDNDGRPDYADACSTNSGQCAKSKEDVYVWKVTPRRAAELQNTNNGGVNVCNPCTAPAGVSINQLSPDGQGTQPMDNLLLGVEMPLGAPRVYSVIVEADLDGDGEWELISSIMLGNGQVHGDFTGLGTTQVHVEVWKNGQKVGEANVSAGVLGTLQGPASIISLNGLPPGQPVLDDLIIKFSNDFNFTPNSVVAATTEAVFTGDELRINALNPTNSAIPLGQLTILGEGEGAAWGITSIDGNNNRIYMPVIVK